MKAPAQMGQAGGAEGILPAIALKPGEVGGRFSMDTTARCLLKAADVKGDTGGVKENMAMKTVDGDGLFLGRDRRTADHAQ